MSNAIIVPEIERAVIEAGISPDGVIALRDAFAPHFQAFQALAAEAATVGQDEPKRARDLRLKVRAVRIAAEKTKTEAKADSLRRGRAIDGINHVLLHSLVPVEEGLEKIEKAEEIRAANKRAALKQVREDEVRPYGDPSFYDLVGMPDQIYADFLVGLKAAHTAKIAAQEAAEKERQEAALAAEAERMRIVTENARLAKIAADEREAREELERAAAKERADRDAREYAIREAAERKAAVERAEVARLAESEAAKRDAAEKARRDAERKAREEAETKAAAALAKERAERLDFERRAKEQMEKERTEHSRIQEEINAKEKAEEDRIAREQASARRAAAAPDREKVASIAAMVEAIRLPEMSTREGAVLMEKVTEQFTKLAKWIRSQSAKIGE